MDKCKFAHVLVVWLLDISPLVIPITVVFTCGTRLKLILNTHLLMNCNLCVFGGECVACTLHNKPIENSVATVVKSHVTSVDLRKIWRPIGPDMLDILDIRLNIGNKQWLWFVRNSFDDISIFKRSQTIAKHILKWMQNTPGTIMNFANPNLKKWIYQFCATN